MSRRYIYVPKTIEDMKCDYFTGENIAWHRWMLSDDEFNVLWDCGVFEYLNEKFDVMIDAFEEEWIMYQYLYLEYDELIKELDKFMNICGREINKLIQLIDMTIECRTYIGFSCRR